MLSINWGYSFVVTAIGIGTTFALLIFLIYAINLLSMAIKATEKKAVPEKQEEAPVVVEHENTTETNPTPHEQAAIAMAMHLYFDAHDEEPHVITIEEVERRYSPWSSKIYNMRNFTK